MQLTIKIDLDNTAFGTKGTEVMAEIKTILSKIVTEYYTLPYNVTLRDSNGNAVGYAEITE